MWLVVVSERLVSLMRLLARLISPNGQTVDRQSYPKLVAVPMGNDKLSKVLSKTPPPLNLHHPLERLMLADLFRADPPPLIPLGPQSDPLNQFFLEPLEPGENPK